MYNRLRQVAIYVIMYAIKTALQANAVSSAFSDLHINRSAELQSTYPVSTHMGVESGGRRGHVPAVKKLGGDVPLIRE